MTGQTFADDDPRAGRDGRDKPTDMPDGLDPALGPAHFAQDIDQRRAALRCLANWGMRSDNEAVRRAAELVLDAAAAGRWREIADDLGVVKNRGGVSDRHRAALEQRNIILRRIRAAIGAALMPPRDAAREVINVVEAYRSAAWHRHEHMRSAPPEPLDALCWALLRMGMSKRLPDIRQLADILERKDDLPVKFMD